MDVYFWFGQKVDNLLFRGFSVNSLGGIIGVCIMISSMAFVFEYLKYLQLKYKHQELLWRLKQLKPLCPVDIGSLLNRNNRMNTTIFERAFLCGVKLSLWLLVQNLGYFLMLIIMVYNGWFLLSALIGSGLGYFIFGDQSMKINIQNCKTMGTAICRQICGDTETLVNEGQSTPVVQETPSTSHTDLECHRRASPAELIVHAECH